MDLSDYFNVNSRAASALRETLALFAKQVNKGDSAHNNKHLEKYARLTFIMTEG